MTSYSCKVFQSDFSAFPDYISACCSCHQGPRYVENVKPDEIDWDEVMKKRLEIAKQFASGNIPECCVGCMNIEPYQEYDYTKFKRIVINHFTQCNCGCVYCARMEYTKGSLISTPQKGDYYDLAPIIKSLYERNLVDKKELTIEFQGGDLSMLLEFEDLVNIFLKNGFKQLVFTTNNIIYQPIIERAFKEANCFIITSLDAGTRETYKKLKRVDKFDDCITNLKKYIKITNEFEPPIHVKYIIVKNFNDNLDELGKFLEIMHNLGIKNVGLDIDYRNIMLRPGVRFDIPKHYYEMFDLFKEKCSEYSMNQCLWDYTQMILKQGGFE